MGADESNRRIKFAYQMEHWSYEGNPALLKANAKKIIPSEYKTDMDGSLFCPGCFTNLNRVPKEKSILPMGEKHILLILELIKREMRFKVN
ncbi:hypothetical protein HND97_16255 [Vibrio cholerae]|nr:hypothetical protein HND97_16255 [Vibrio cholerae]